jgi:hypothetical protein
VKNFALHPILPGSEKNFTEGVYIILFNASSIPPHLLLSINGAIYSITDSGRQLGSPLEKLVLFIKRKNVPAIFVEWRQLESWKVDRLENLALECFSKYERVVEGKVSCLFPIRDVVAAVLGDELKKAGFIFELLPAMQKANALGESFELNMGSAIVDSSFELLTYTNEQLKQALQPAK